MQVHCQSNVEKVQSFLVLQVRLLQKQQVEKQLTLETLLIAPQY